MAMVVITRRRQIELKMKWKFIGNQQLRFDDLLRKKGPCWQLAACMDCHATLGKLDYLFLPVNVGETSDEKPYSPGKSGKTTL